MHPDYHDNTTLAGATAPNSNKRFSLGLVVGKFSPLHLGHEFLIGEAQRYCDRVVLISYSNPELAGCERDRREAWLRARFPQAAILVIDDATLALACTTRSLPVRTIPLNDAADVEQREFVGWLCHHMLGTTVDAVFTSEAYGEGFARSLTAQFSALLGVPHRVAHISVDPARRRVPVSGTSLRANAAGARSYLSPLVNASFKRRICVLGGESTGKTTLAQALAARYGSAWVPEYGRERWEQRGGQLAYGDMTEIAEQQVLREQATESETAGDVFCDTSPLTTLFYSLAMFGEATPRLQALACRRYDLVFLCVPDFPFVQDGTRSDDAFRQRQHQWYERELGARGVPYTLLNGPLEQRIKTVAQTLTVASAATGNLSI